MALKLVLWLLLATSFVACRSREESHSRGILGFAFPTRLATQDSATLAQFKSQLCSSAPAVGSQVVLPGQDQRSRFLNLLIAIGGMPYDQLSSVLIESTSISPIELPRYIRRLRSSVIEDKALLEPKNAVIRQRLIESLTDEKDLRIVIDAYAQDTANSRLNDMTASAALKSISRENLDRYAEALLKNLTPEEESILEFAKAIEPATVHRTAYTNLQQILQKGVLMSPKVADEEHALKLPVSRFSNSYEEDLFKSSNYVFATVGPFDGRTKWGDVAFRFKEKHAELEQDGVLGWSSYITGYHFGKSTRFRPPADIRGAFSRLLIVPENQREFMAHLLLKYLRDKPPADRQQLLAELDALRKSQADPRALQQAWGDFLEKNWLGYMEAHFYQQVPLDALQSIEVSAAMRGEIETWDIPEPLRELIIYN